MRLLGLFLILAAAVMIPFLIWGDWFMQQFDQAGAAGWLERLGPWAWLAAIGLLVADLFLPVPATPVMSALGWVYGPWLGGGIGAAGSFLSGWLAYALCRKLGERVAMKILGEKDLDRGRAFFAKVGGWGIALTRWVPILPEVACCMAGLTRMPARQFLPALACGSLPLAFTYAWIGAQGRDQPGWALAGWLLVAVVPILLWAITAAWLRRSHQGAAGNDK